MEPSQFSFPFVYKHCSVSRCILNRATGAGIGLYLIKYTRFTPPMFTLHCRPEFVVTFRYPCGCRTLCRLFCLLTNTSLTPFDLISVRRKSGNRTRPINEIVQPDYNHSLSPIPCFQHNHLYFSRV